MLISLIIISIITFGGLSLTYLFARDETFLWRLAAGNIVGSALFGLVCFVLACFFGLSVPTVLAALIAAFAPVWLVAKNAERKRQFKTEWSRAKNRTHDANAKKFRRLAYYLFFIVLFLAFFDKAIIIAPDGIFTGGTQNLGDLPYHLGAIFSFIDGNNFPPQNPSFAGAKFTYPFIADFLTACLVKSGASLSGAMLAQNTFWAFALLVIFERFVFKLTGSRLAGKIAPFILFFSGGLGFLWFFKDFWYGTQGLWEILWNLPRDYTIGEKFRWGNSLVVLFITQRSLLLGMPLTIIVLGFLWRIFGESERASEGEKERGREGERGKRSGVNKEISGNLLETVIPSLTIGLLAGTLPLIHAHSLAVLFVVSAFLFFFSLENWRKWLWFAAGVALVAVPELFWIMQGSATRTSEFIAWHFGWDARTDNVFWFWLKNTGIFIPLLLGGLLLLLIFAQKRRKADEAEIESEKAKSKKEKNLRRAAAANDSRRGERLLLFYIPFAFLFVLANLAKFAPWEWDNIKILIYWFAVSIPFAAFVPAWLWQKKNLGFKLFAALALFVLIFAGALDVWRTASGQIRYGVFDRDAVAIAEELKKETEPDDLFLNAPTFNSAIVLTGRRSLMRYGGHLSSHGIDYAERETDLRRIYAGEASAEILLDKYGIEYVLISPREREYMNQISGALNEAYFQKFTLAARFGEYKVYKVR